MATKSESAPGPDGIPKTLHWCAGGLGSQFLFDAYKSVLEGGAVPTEFAASWTVFNPNNQGTRLYLLMVPRLDHPKKPCRPKLSSTLSVCLC